ncbi:MAG: 5-bromo-4-chloroindolyl phosphate hydrolysis family protein [Roseburia sp.]|nr:5-bromo-4-chloroindolyl phosphate hydrolysis family protein [Roseburia sp.]MCM1242523.1 5-bromo-4-chloroindolyl phosphate hydrolysis family protein [Roseburia sp.]
MSDNQNWNRMGEQFKGALADALQSGNFNDLNDLVTQTVTNSLKDAGINITRNTNTDTQAGRQAETGQDPQSAKTAETYTEQTPPRYSQRPQPQRQTPQRRQMNPPVKFNKTGNVSNVLYQVFGGVGLGLSGIAAFVQLILLGTGIASPIGWGINLLFLIFFFGMVRLGIGQRRRLKRAARYMKLCGAKMYGEIEDLARDTGKSIRYIIKDLQKMLSLGMFPEGHLDEQKTCFMLNDTIYGHYLEAESGRRMREAHERELLEQNDLSKNTDSSVSLMPREQADELHTMITEGMECIRKLRALNDQIPGEVISAKLSSLESLLKDIFDSLKEHPEQMHRMHKLMDYYLPTTLKLVEAYAEFDRISTPGEEIISAKAEIENTLDTINQAFRELLNNLFQDAVFDATTDAQVLKTMLASEGLTKDMK